MSDIFAKDDLPGSQHVVCRLPPPPDGQADWMTREELDAFNGAIDTDSVSIGNDVWHEQSISISKERMSKHVFIVGPAQEPAKISHALGWFVRNGLEKKQSLVVLDTSGQLMQEFAWKLSQTHDVFVVNFADFEKSSIARDLQWNPLAHIPLLDTSTAEAKLKTGVRQEEAAQALAEVWVRHTIQPTEQEPFLARDAQWLIHACVLHLRATNPHAPLSYLGELLCYSGNLFAILKHSPSERAREIYETHLAPLKKPYQAEWLYFVWSRLSSNASTILIESKTSHNEVDFTHLLRKPVVLFYQIPFVFEGGNQPFTAMFFTQMFLMQKYAYEDWALANAALLPEKRQPPLPGVRCILDEFTACGTPLYLQEYMKLQSEYGGAVIATGPRGYSEWQPRSIPTAEVLLNTAATHLLLPFASQKERAFYATLCGTAIDEGHQVPLLTPDKLITMLNPDPATRWALLYQQDGPPTVIELRNAYYDADARIKPVSLEIDHDNLDRIEAHQRLGVTPPAGLCADESTPDGVVF